MPKTSIRDVAKHAGVSIATVSHVINNTRFVKEETKKLVEESIQELGYRPDATARSFKTGRKNLIAFIVPDIANAFFSTLIEELETVISRENYKLIVINTKETKEREIDNLRVLASGVVDGFVVASTLENYRDMADIVPPHMPMVFVDRILSGCPHDTITVTNYQAMYAGIEYLIRQGHQQIGYITGLPHISTTMERLEAYTNAMKASGLFSEDLIRMGDSMSTCIPQNLDALLNQHCTALVVSNNVMAVETMMQLDQRDMKIGRDIELLGYQDSEQAQYGLNRAHLIHQPVVELGRAAGKQILERLEHPDLPMQKVILQATFLPHQPAADKRQQQV